MEKPDFDSHLKETVSAKIETAITNAIPRDKLFKLEDELDELGKSKNLEAYEREDEIERELMASCVVAETIVEFKEVLIQVGKMYNKTEDWAEDLLAHENAHANVGEAVGYEVKGYIVLFSKDNAGRIYSQPAVFSRSNRDWNTVEKAMKNIVMYEAPLKYGEVMSDGDIEMAERAHLKLKLFGKVDPASVDRVKNELGDIWVD